MKYSDKKNRQRLYLYTHISYISYTYPIHITLVVPSRQCLFTYYFVVIDKQLLPNHSENLLIISQIFTNFQLCLPPFSEGRKWRFFLNSPHTHHSFPPHKWTALRYVLVIFIFICLSLSYFLSPRSGNPTNLKL